MTNSEFQEQNELLQSEVAYYKELLHNLKQAAINSKIVDKPEMYNQFAEFSHSAIALVEMQVEMMYHDANDTEPYERDLTTDNKQDS